MVVEANSTVDEVRDLVRQVKEAVNAANLDSTNNLVVTQLDLELKTTLKKSAGGEISLKVIEIGGGYSSQDINTIEISLEPKKSVELFRSVKNDLSEAVKVIQEAVYEAERVHPRYGLKNAKITLQVGKTTEGKISLFLKGGASEETTHKVVLTLSSPS